MSKYIVMFLTVLLLVAVFFAFIVPNLYCIIMNLAFMVLGKVENVYQCLKCEERLSMVIKYAIAFWTNTLVFMILKTMLKVLNKLDIFLLLENVDQEGENLSGN